MIRKTNPILRNAIHIALYIGVASTLAAVPAVAEEGNEADEEVIVTGSRIQRSTLAQSTDVVTMGEAEIEATGDLMIADVLRSSPLNAYGSFSERSGSSAQSNATIDLRGLGSQRTLVLVNGRRIPGSPNLGAASVNINMIPMAAVERIDILPNSASAVYGSDAEAGVVNIILKQNFEGFEITARHGERSEDDGIEEGASLVGGASNDRGNITYAIEWNRRDPIFDRDRKYTAPWIRDNGDGRLDIYLDTDGISFYGKTVELYDPNTGFFDIQAANGCPTTGGFMGEMGLAAFGLPNSTACTYAYGDISANKTSLNRFNTYIDTNYELTDNVEFFASAIFSRVESWGRYAPPAAGWSGYPADYPDNPFDIDAMIADGTISEDYELYGYYRWTNIGPRNNTVTDTQYDVSGGFRGDLSDTLSYEVYAQYNRYDSKELGTYYLSYPGLTAVLEQGIDPFSPEGAGLMRATTSQDNYTTMTKYFGQLQWSVGDMFGAGDMIVLGGMEYFENDYVNLYDAASEAGQVGGSAGNSSAGERDVTAFFAEVVVPLPMNFELDAAIRYDDYSDFGSEVSPSLGLIWQAMDALTLRAHWGQGFRAPALSDLYGPVTFSAEDAIDYTTCFAQGTAAEDCPERQIDTYYSSNPDLDAETSTSFSLGASWEFIDDWTADVSYWNIQIDDVISDITGQEVLYAEAAGVALNPADGVWVDRTGGGPPTIHTGTANSGEMNVDGFDFQLQGMFDTKFGMWTPSLMASYTRSFEQQVYYKGPVQETAGFNMQPEWRWQAGLGWNLGKHYVDMTVDYIGEHSEADFIVVNPNGAVLETSNKNLDSWTTLNLSYKYETDDWGALKIGARNLTNEEPVLDKDGKFSQDHMSLYNNTGRVVYVEYTLKY